MNRTARLAAYAVVLALSFAGGAAAGATIGPEPAPSVSTPSDDAVPGAGEPHEGEH